MKLLLILLYLSLTSLVCSPNGAETLKKNSSDSIKLFVTAKIDGVLWESKPDQIMVRYYEIDDKLTIFTEDTKNEMNFLLSFNPYSKTQIGKYSSVKEGAGGYGITLNDNNTSDDLPKDYDNYHQGAVQNCLIITSITDTKEGKLIAGTFASPMNVSNNYDKNKDKGVVVTEGKFLVLLEK